MGVVKSMPICPKCGFEYREGFDECADCGVKLVDSTGNDTGNEPKPAGEFPAEAFLCEAQNPIEASIIESILDEYNIPHRSSLSGIGGIHALAGPTLAVEIYVPEPALEAAREAIAKANEGIDDDWYDSYYDSPELSDADGYEDDTAE
jgi:hypothetical protein